MQGKGWWLNPHTGQGYQVILHETWLQNQANLDQAEIPKAWHADILQATDTDTIRLYGTKAGLIRIRDYGNYISAQFWCERSQIRTRIRAIHDFLSPMYYPHDEIVLGSLGTDETIRISISDLGSKLQNGEQIMLKEEKDHPIEDIKPNPRLMKRIEDKLQQYLDHP